MKPSALSLLSLVLFAAAPDPFAGAWKLNAGKSLYPTGQCPKSMTVAIIAVGNGIRYHSETEFTNGRKSTATYTAEYGGPEALVTGSSGMQAPVALKRIDARTVEAVYTRFMRTVASSRRVVSPDGRTMTITTSSKDRDGKEVTNVGVYDRVE